MITLAGELLFKIILTTFLLLDNSLKIFGVAMVASMWFPSFLIASEWILTMNSMRSKISFSQLVLLMIMLPFTPLLSYSKQLGTFEVDMGSFDVGFVTELTKCSFILDLALFGLKVNQLVEKPKNLKSDCQ